MINHTNTQICGGVITQLDHKGKGYESWAIGLRNLSSMNEREKRESRNGWDEIEWKKGEIRVKDIQEKIVIAIMKNDFKEVYKQQWYMIQTFEAKALAIRRVVTNKGGKTAGVDKIIWNSPKDYWEAIQKLHTIIENNKNYQA